MKRIIFAVLITIICSSVSSAQSPIIDIENHSFRNSISNAYYKDINNYLDPFVGTWLYTDGNIQIKIVLTKRTMVYTGKFYRDALGGEYQYIENGTELVNTLDNTDVLTSGLAASHIIRNNKKPNCDDCAPDERRVSLLIRDIERELSGRLTLKRIIVNGQEALRGYIMGGGPYTYPEDDPPAYFNMRVPAGTYILFKQ